MSVIIVGGNERMERLYSDACLEHGCRAKVFTKVSGDIRKLLGNADLYILFTNTASHKLVQCAMSEAKKTKCLRRALPHQQPVLLESHPAASLRQVRRMNGTAEATEEIVKGHGRDSPRRALLDRDVQPTYAP